MNTLRNHQERQLTGSQPVRGLLCTQGWSKAIATASSLGSQGYALLVAGTPSTDRTPAIGFPMNPEGDL